MTFALAGYRTALTPPWVRDPLWRRAQAVPLLDLRFAENRSLVNAVTGASLVTFTRASSGTFVDSARTLQTAATDVPRFNHNLTTGESLGLLVEEQKTNLPLNTVLAGGTTPTSWSLGSGVATVASSIYGNSDGGIALSFATNADRNFIQQTVALAANTTYVFSVLVESFANFATTNGNVISLNNGPAGSTITAASGSPAVGQRITTTIAVGATAGNVTMRMGLGVGSNTTGTINLSRPQLEAGAFPTSYIPTTTAAATRSADVASLISQAIANNIRTLYLEFSSPASGTRGVGSLNDNTANERVDVLTSGTDPRLVVVDGGVEQANVNGGTVTANQRTRVAVRINANNFAISINGGAVVTDASGTLPTVDRLMLGRTQAGEYLNGTLARVIGWDIAQPDLQSLTQ